MAPYILEMFAASAEHSDEMESEQNFISTFKLLNNYDQIIGGGVITYTKDDYNRQVNHFKKSLLMKAGVVFVVFALLASVGIMFAFRNLRNYLKSIEDSHEKIRTSKTTGLSVL